MDKKQKSLWDKLNKEEDAKITRIEKARKEKDVGYFERFFGLGDKKEKIKMGSLGRSKSNKSDFL